MSAIPAGARESGQTYLDATLGRFPFGSAETEGQMFVTDDADVLAVPDAETAANEWEQTFSWTGDAAEDVLTAATQRLAAVAATITQPN